MATTRLLQDRRILAVEDDYFLAMELERDLKQAGAVVLGPAPSVEKALELLGVESPIEAAVLDINLGGELAFPVADALLARNIPVVFLTGYVDGGLDARYPTVARCDKPCEFRKLEQALAALL